MPYMAPVQLDSGSSRIGMIRINGELLIQGENGDYEYYIDDIYMKACPADDFSLKLGHKKSKEK